MRRRTLLASLATTGAATIGGCSSLPALPPRYPPVRVEEVTDTSAYDHDFEVELLESFSPDQPARLEITLRNTADRERTAILGGSRQPFSDVFPDDPAGGIVLLPDDRTGIVPYRSASTADDPAETGPLPPDEPIDGCWRLDRDVVIYQGAQLVSLAPGEVITGRYSVFSSSSADLCLFPGTYPFTSSGYFDSEERCGFTLRIE